MKIALVNLSHWVLIAGMCATSGASTASANSRAAKITLNHERLFCAVKGVRADGSVGLAFPTKGGSDEQFDSNDGIWTASYDLQGLELGTNSIYEVPAKDANGGDSEDEESTYGDLILGLNKAQTKLTIVLEQERKSSVKVTLTKDQFDALRTKRAHLLDLKLKSFRPDVPGSNYLAVTADCQILNVEN